MITPAEPDDLHINGLTVPSSLATDEDGDLQQILTLDATCQVLNSWKDQDAEHRNYGWTNSPDDREPATAFVVWIASDGKLCTEYIDPFWDGSTTHNAFALSELSAIGGLDMQKKEGANVQ